MSVHVWPMRIRTRVFRIFYAFNLDAAATEGIKLGVFGDLRMGERYALGLIARSKIGPPDIERVGRLAQPLVRNPYLFLRQTYEEIWGASDPERAFEDVFHRDHHAVTFICSSSKEEMLDQEPSTRVAVEDVRAWCMDRLREELRKSFRSWMAELGAVPATEREQIDVIPDAA
jgi:hypothetical protein